MKKKNSGTTGNWLPKAASLLLLCLTLAATGKTPAQAAAKASSAQTTSVSAADTTSSTSSKKTSSYTGWKTVKGKKYYLVKGRRTTGWKKISGKYYYFNSKGQLQKNTIAGTKKSGYYYVDNSGVRVTTKEMRLAVRFVLQNSDSTGTKAQRLLECYTALRSYPYKRYYGDQPGTETLAGYARDMFQNKTGNCYRYASAMAYIAKALGYKVRVAVGGVSAYSSTLSPHGWCEVKIGSFWKILDVSMHNGHPNATMYLVTREQYPYRLRCDKVYTMSISKGTLTWK